jgi:hypothetical protein
MRRLSREMIESSVRSMRAMSRLAWESVSPPRERASRQSVRAAVSMRGRGSSGLGPAWAATSSSERPDSTAFSNSSARLFMLVKRTPLSRMIAHDHRDITARPIITPFTTQSAVMNR